MRYLVQVGHEKDYQGKRYLPETNEGDSVIELRRCCSLNCRAEDAAHNQSSEWKLLVVSPTSLVESRSTVKSQGPRAGGCSDGTSVTEKPHASCLSGDHSLPCSSVIKQRPMQVSYGHMSSDT